MINFRHSPRVPGLRPPSPFDRAGGRAHLIGIAGSGMQALTQVLVDRKWRVSGSDLNPAARQIVAEGLRVEPAANPVSVLLGHAADHIPADTHVVVYSDAITSDNPERRRAMDRQIPTLSYPQALGRLMSGKRGIAISGTHGKSTTTAMLAEILLADGIDPTYLIGARPMSGLPAGRAGASDMMLVEACEYRANFLNLSPQAAAILNVEPDHFDFYRTIDQLHAAFAEFARRIPTGGLVLANHDCAAALWATTGVSCRVSTFGLQAWADWSATNLKHERGCFRYRLLHQGRPRFDVVLQVPGKHQVLNSLAAAALAHEAGADDQAIKGALAGFRGLERRLEYLGEWHGAHLIDDFAHHPTEVAAALAAVRLIYPGRRICCVFQPHQVSRTAHLLDEFAASLQNADQVAVAEIFPAREPLHARHRVTATHLAHRVRQLGGEVWPVHAMPAILDRLEQTLVSGDVLVTLGAGDVRKISHALTARLQGHRAVG
jgi:UDP-N-acetylmuramate--alanine ligase